MLPSHTLGAPSGFCFGVSIALGALLCPESPRGLAAVCSTLLVASLVFGAPCSWSTICSALTSSKVSAYRKATGHTTDSPSHTTSVARNGLAYASTDCGNFVADLEPEMVSSVLGGQWKERKRLARTELTLNMTPPATSPTAAAPCST